MLELKSAFTYDEVLLLMTATTEGIAVDADAVLAALDRLFGKEEGDGQDEYVIVTSGTVPEAPGPVRDRMWGWIERIEKRLGIDVEVWGSSGELMTPSTIDGRAYSLDDFGQTDDGEYCVERDLATSLSALAEFHRAWRMFAQSERRRRKFRERLS